MIRTPAVPTIPWRTGEAIDGEGELPKPAEERHRSAAPMMLALEELSAPAVSMIARVKPFF